MNGRADKLWPEWGWLHLIAEHIIGASLSEPHIDEFAVEFLYIYVYISRTSCRKSYPALILRVLASFVNSKTIHKLLVLNSARRHQPSSNSKDGDHSWTYLFNG